MNSGKRAGLFFAFVAAAILPAGCQTEGQGALLGRADTTCGRIAESGTDFKNAVKSLEGALAFVAAVGAQAVNEASDVEVDQRRSTASYGRGSVLVLEMNGRAPDLSQDKRGVGPAVWNHMRAHQAIQDDVLWQSLSTAERKQWLLALYVESNRDRFDAVVNLRTCKPCKGTGALGEVELSSCQDCEGAGALRVVEYAPR